MWNKYQVKFLLDNPGQSNWILGKILHKSQDAVKKKRYRLRGKVKLETLINIKIGRNNYDITEKDEFMDNKFIVQLLTQSKEKMDWGHRAHPVLPKRVLKELEGFKRIQHENGYPAGVDIFHLEQRG